MGIISDKTVGMGALNDSVGMTVLVAAGSACVVGECASRGEDT
jgi:hypothetical protein